MKKYLLSLLLALLIPLGAVAQEAYAILDGGTLTFYYDNQKSSRSGTKYELNIGDNAPDWNSNHSSITKVVFDASFAAARPTSTSWWFYNCSNLKEIEGINYLKTGSVTNMLQMFRGCSSLTTLDLSGFDTGNVTYMDHMFYGCSGLTTLDLSGFDTRNVTDMGFMFYECNSLTTLDVSRFKTGNVTSMSQMFLGCSSLTSLDVSGFDTRNVTAMQFMFYECSSLTTLDVSSFHTGNVINTQLMFYGCSGLTTLDLSGFDTRNVTDMLLMFKGCSSLTTIYCGDDWNTDKVFVSYDMFSDCTNLVGGAGTTYNSDHTDKGYAHVDGGISDPGYLTLKSGGVKEAYAVLDGGTLTFYYDNQKSSRSGTKYELNTGNNNPGWINNCRSIKKAVFDASFADARPTSTLGWFYDCSNLTTIEGISNLKTENVTDMSFMFSGCSSLTTLDVSGFDTGNVTYMGYMFYGCSGLTTLDLSSFDTRNVTGMEYLFRSCSSLTTLDVSGFETGNAADMSGIFSGCSSLTTLDVSGFETGNVTSMRTMFYDCSGLTSLDLSGFDTGNVTDMAGMFRMCNGLTTLDFSGFDTGNVTDMSSMFYGCSGLTAIYCGDDWNTDKVTSSSNMFRNCTNLVGGAGTTYTSDHRDKEYAHVDGGISDPGYLTYKGISTIALATGDNSIMLNRYDGNTKDVMLKFNIASGKWVTLCVPFNVTAAQAAETLGDDADIEELSTSAYDDDTKQLTLTFTSCTSIVAGRPYVVKVSETKTTPTFYGVTIDKTAPAAVSTTYCTMTGIYNATPLTAGDKNTLFIQNNLFYYPSTAASLPATKCYFTLTNGAEQARGIGMQFWDDDVVSAIRETNVSGADGDTWYTLQGIRVRRPAGKGLYIHGSKKVFAGNRK